VRPARLAHLPPYRPGASGVVVSLAIALSDDISRSNGAATVNSDAAAMIQ